MRAPARLVWERSDGQRTDFPLDGEAFDVGRGKEAGIRIDEPLVSRCHARIERRGDAWVVTDLGSTNFTRVNGQRLRSECVLADGDELRFGRARCRFVLGEATGSSGGAKEADRGVA
jgi:pSer/pThr/pTyr-binding forkhead associated (FHA) protein